MFWLFWLYLCFSSPFWNFIDIIAFCTFNKITSKISITYFCFTVLASNDIKHRSAGIVISAMITGVFLGCCLYFLIVHTEYTADIPKLLMKYIWGIPLFYFLWILFWWGLEEVEGFYSSILNFIPFRTISSLPWL